MDQGFRSSKLGDRRRQYLHEQAYLRAHPEQAKPRKRKVQVQVTPVIVGYRNGVPIKRYPPRARQTASGSTTLTKVATLRGARPAQAAKPPVMVS